MKVIFIFIIIALLNSIITFLPNWDITINDDLVSNTNSYTYTAFKNTSEWNVYLKLERTISKSSSDVSITNYVTMGMNYNDVGPRKVPFDNVDSFYYIHNNYYICPKGAYNVYDFTNQNYITPKDFSIQNKDYDLKCHYNEESKMLLVLYLRNGDYTWYSTYIHDGTKLEDMRKVGKLSDQLYDFKLEPQGSENYYYLMGLVRVGNWLKAANVKIKLLKGEEGYNMVDNQKEIVEERKYSQVYYLNKYADNQYNDFFYFTYDEPSKFYNGYTTTASSNYRDVLKYEIKKNVFSFEFKEDIEVEKIDFMLYNRFIYYIMKSTESSKKYYGIFDTKLNKPVFNTDEELIKFIPNSGIDMLAITSKSAYIICAIKDGTSCVDYCSNNYLIDTTKGSQCSSSSSCTFEAYPYGICIKECDYMHVLRNNSLCGLCKDFDSKNIYKLNGTNTCLATIKEESMELMDTKWNIVSCKTGYILENDDCVEIKNCHPLCEKDQCHGPSTDDNNQQCKSCQPNYFLENVNCKKECSEGYIISGKECQKCTLNNCQKLEKNNITCICETCNNHYYLKNNECSICDNSCNGCQGEPTNCTSCQANNFLYNNKCYSCQYEHCEKYKEDNCACDICKEGYYNEGFVCKKCQSNNCKKCTSEECLECENNNFFVNDEGNCTECPTNCEIKVSENTCQCKVCKEGYFLDNYQCEKCDETCETCEGNKYNCIACAKNGFRNDNNQCELCDEICSTCEGNKKNCTTCGEHGFRNENDECEFCDNSCKGCSLSDTNCTSCNNGNYLIDNTCKECDSKCLTCENKDECLSCRVGTYLINDEFNKTCVDNCTEYGREFDHIERGKCAPLRRNNGTDGDGANKADDNLLLWIFVGIIGFILLIITICICIKCCRNRTDSDSIEKTIDLDLTNGQNCILNDD